MISPS